MKITLFLASVDAFQHRKIQDVVRLIIRLALCSRKGHLHFRTHGLKARPMP